MHAIRYFIVLLCLVLIQSFIGFNMYGVMMWILTEDCGFSDWAAGFIFGGFSCCVAVYGFFMGPFVDKMGIQKTFLFQLCFSTLGKIIMVFTLHPVAVCAALFGPLSLGASVSHSIGSISIQRYVPDRHRDLCFSIRYAVMNVGAIASSFVVDAFRLHVDSPFSWMSKWSFYIACWACLNVIPLFLILIGIRDVEVDGDWNVQPTSFEQPQILDKFKETIKNSMFRRFVLVSVGLVGAASVFVYDYSLYPLYMKRAPFPVDNPELMPFMWFLSIDPFIVVILSLVIGLLVHRFQWDIYWMIISGTLLGATAPFFMMFTQYWGVVIFISIAAVGESIWSPLLERYICKFTEKGKEGVFFGTMGIIKTLASLVTSSGGGLLLGLFCRAAHECSRGIWIWFIAGLLALSSPLFLLATMKWTRIRDSEVPYEKLQVELDEIKEEKT